MFLFIHLEVFFSCEAFVYTVCWLLWALKKYLYTNSAHAYIDKMVNTVSYADHSRSILFHCIVCLGTVGSTNYWNFLVLASLSSQFLYVSSFILIRYTIVKFQPNALIRYSYKLVSLSLSFSISLRLSPILYESKCLFWSMWYFHINSHTLALVHK